MDLTMKLFQITSTFNVIIKYSGFGAVDYMIDTVYLLQILVDKKIFNTRIHWHASHVDIFRDSIQSLANNMSQQRQIVIFNISMYLKAL